MPVIWDALTVMKEREKSILVKWIMKWQKKY